MVLYTPFELRELERKYEEENHFLSSSHVWIVRLGLRREEKVNGENQREREEKKNSILVLSKPERLRKE